MVLRAACAIGLATIVVVGVACRGPVKPLVEDRSVGYYYDPRAADALGERFPAMKAQHERYRTALAEPVSVVAWNDRSSTSDVFYATNRLPHVDDAGTLQYGTGWGDELALGTVQVTLPRAERGKSADGPPVGQRLAGWLPGGASVEDDAASVEVAAPELLDEEEYFAAVRDSLARAPEQDLLLFVHGFNVDFDSSAARAAQIAVDLPFNGAVIAYSWPSQGGVKNYATDEGIVASSVEPFSKFLQALDAAVPSTSRIQIVVHSMGNRLVLGALARLSDRFRNPPRFDNLVLCAPDVGVRDFEELAADVTSTARRVTLYVNQSDTALIASKGLHGQQRIGDAFPPVVVEGVETIDASAIDLSFMGHSYYGSNRRALSDLFALVKENKGAAERPWLGQEGENGWWSFTSQPAEIRWAWYFDHLQPASATNEPAT